MSGNGSAAQTISILDLPNELLETIFRYCVVLDHIHKCYDPRIVLQATWRKEYIRAEDFVIRSDGTENICKAWEQTEIWTSSMKAEENLAPDDEDGYPKHLDRQGKPMQGHKYCLAVARVCTRFRDIAMHVYYSKNTFSFTAPSYLERFIQNLHYYGRSETLIKRVYLHLGNAPTHVHFGNRSSLDVYGAPPETYIDFFRPRSWLSAEGSKDSGLPKSPFARMCPNLQMFELDFFLMDDVFFGFFGMKEIAKDLERVIAEHVRVPRVRTWGWAGLRHEGMEKIIMGLGRNLDEDLRPMLNMSL